MRKSAALVVLSDLITFWLDIHSCDEEYEAPELVSDVSGNELEVNCPHAKEIIQAENVIIKNLERK